MKIYPLIISSKMYRTQMGVLYTKYYYTKYKLRCAGFWKQNMGIHKE